MAAWRLASNGLKVLMLEAGRPYDPQRETPMFTLPREAPLRGSGTPDKEFGFFDATVHGGWEMPGEPYSSAPGSKFMWWRSRMLGGRTNHWARNSFRMGPYDFKPRSRDGLGCGHRREGARDDRSRPDGPPSADAARRRCRSVGRAPGRWRRG